MGKRERVWQETGYVLGYFGKRVSTTRKKYRSYIEEGIELGKRPELVGGGLIRSLGGWDEVRKMRLSGRDRIKSDQRILGESEFIMEVLSESEEQFSRKYKLKSQGYDLKRIIERVSELCELEKDYITGKGRQQDRVMARDLLCYWASIELGITIVDLARRLDLTPAAVSYAVQRGEKLAKEKN